MKYIIVSLFVVFGLNACVNHTDDGYYDRANSASEKAHDKLNRD